jgi:hypothetical protein
MFVHEFPACDKLLIGRGQGESLNSLSIMAIMSRFLFLPPDESMIAKSSVAPRRIPSSIILALFVNHLSVTALCLSHPIPQFQHFAVSLACPRHFRNRLRRENHSRHMSHSLAQGTPQEQELSYRSCPCRKIADTFTQRLPFSK